MISLLLACTGADTATEPPDSGQPADGAVLELSGPVSCESPGEAVLSTIQTTGDWVSPETDPGTPTSAWGMAVFDVNGDGLLDIYLPRIGQDVLLLAEGDGRFVSSPLPAGTDGTAVGAVPVDFDGDGNLDVVVSQMGPDLLLASDGAGGLTDVTAKLGFDSGDGLSFASTWADFDGDGDLDCAIPVFTPTPFPPGKYEPGEGPPGAPSLLLENRGAEGFVDVSALLPETNDGYPMLMGFHDLDGDLTPELVVINDHGREVRSNRAWRWSGTRFEDVSEALGLDRALDGMGLGAGDLDGDQLPDLLVTDWDNLLLLESASGEYTDTTLARGLTAPHSDAKVAWGAALADLDNDADLDAVVNYGFWELYGVVDSSNPAAQPDAVWLQEDGIFSPVADAWGVDHTGSGRGLVVADMDGDGSLDVLKQEVFGETLLLGGQCDGAAWLSVSLQDSTTANRLGVGARISIAAGGIEQVRWLHAGGVGLASGGPPVAHFGLGEAEIIEQLVVTWPDGTQSAFANITPRQHAQIRR